MKQTIIWTALPKGMSADGKNLLLSVVVSPRLDTEGPPLKLSAFPAFTNWPAQPLQLSIQFNGQAPVAATIIPSGADAALWQALFPPEETSVRSFVPADQSKQLIHSYPVANVVEHLRKLYAAVGVASPTDLPLITELAQKGATLVRTVEGQGREWLNLDDHLEQDLLGRYKRLKTTALPPGPPEPAMDFFRAKHFHRFKGGNRENPVPKPEFDFHEAVAMVGNHPLLLRRLGLVIEVSVPLAGQPASGTVQVAEVHHQFAGDDQPLRVRYLLDTAKKRFLPAPAAASDLADGWLRLGTSDFSIQQVDADGAALKAIDFANQLQMRQQGRLKTVDSPQDDGLPALRAGGVSVVRTGRAVRLANTFKTVTQANTTLNPQNPPELWADDVTGGFRVDVQDAAGTWRSLCRRGITYRMGRLAGPQATITATDEGTVTAAAMQDVDPTKNDFYLHEALFHWDGWSLVAPRPGEAIQNDGLSHGENLGPDGKARNPSSTSLNLEITAEPTPKSLPRLRFGGNYRIRARAVDVAGNSLPFDSTDASQASPPVTYRRFEPVEAPAVAIVSAVPLSNLPGESTARLVIRSYNDTPADDGVLSPETSERLLLPPRTAVATIEQYGLLDTPTGVDATPATWNLLATKDAAALPDVYSDPTNLPAEVPYLADPFAAAAVLRGLPGTAPESAQAVTFDASPGWWQGKPFRIAVIEGNGPPSWDVTERILTVELPKATVTRVRLSSRVIPADLEKLAVWKWIEEEAFDDEDRARLKQLALDGLHWMLTPFRELTLVHAVQQPLAPPVIEVLNPRKTALGDTFATVEGAVGVHAPSTGKVDLLARWSEPTGIGFARTNGESHAFDLPVASSETPSVPWGGRRHEFGDTKYRKVGYYAIATTRFRDYFDPSLTTDDLTRPPQAELPPNSDTHLFEAEVLNSARPLAPNLLYVVPTFGWEAGEDERGTFSRRTGGLRLYLEEPWFSSGDGELLGVVMWPGERDWCISGKPLRDTFVRIEVPDELKPYASQWGRDPIWLSGPTQQVPSLQNFTKAVAVQTSLTIEERPDALVAVAGHEVGYDEERHLFYCDMDIDAGDSYYPFVRLALVRYQPKSIGKAELSRVVLADFAQFAPDRICWVARDAATPSTLRITVSGTGYRRNASFNCTGDIEARLERWLGPGEGDMGWVPVSIAPVTLFNAQALKTLSVWEGTIALPVDDPDARFRVVVEEYEAFLGDVPEAGLTERFGSGRERRLVYSDAVEVGVV